MKTCIFCNHITEEQIIYQTEHFKLVFDIDPIQTGHLLLMTKDHYDSLASLPKALLYQLIELEAYLTRLLEETLPISGVTLARNDRDLMDYGTHFHSHLIPRMREDHFWDSITLSKENWDIAPFLEQLRSL